MAFTSLFQNEYNNNKKFRKAINKAGNYLEGFNGNKGGGGEQKIGGLLIGAIITAITTAISTGVGVWQQKRQHQLNEESADNADARTRALYNDLESPAAKRQQLEEAGMSIGMMYGGGGGLSGGLASGAQAAPTQQAGGAEILAMLPQLVQSLTNMKKSDAEIANIKKDTELKDAEIQKKTEETTYTKALTAEKNLTNALINPTFELNAEQTRALTAKYWEEKNALLLENEFNEKTMQDRVESIKKYNNLLDSQIQLTKAQTAVAQEQKKLIMQETTNAKDIGRILKCDADTAEAIYNFKTQFKREGLNDLMGIDKNSSLLTAETMLDMLTKFNVWADGFNQAAISKQVADNFNANLWFNWINEGIRTGTQVVNAASNAYGVKNRMPNNYNTYQYGDHYSTHYNY